MNEGETDGQTDTARSGPPLSTPRCKIPWSLQVAKCSAPTLPKSHRLPTTTGQDEKPPHAPRFYPPLQQHPLRPPAPSSPPSPSAPPPSPKPISPPPNSPSASSPFLSPPLQPPPPNSPTAGPAGRGCSLRRPPEGAFFLGGWVSARRPPHPLALEVPVPPPPPSLPLSRPVPPRRKESDQGGAGLIKAPTARPRLSDTAGGHSKSPATTGPRPRHRPETPAQPRARSPLALEGADPGHLRAQRGCGGHRGAAAVPVRCRGPTAGHGAPRGKVTTERRRPPPRAKPRPRLRPVSPSTPSPAASSCKSLPRN